MIENKREYFECACSYPTHQIKVEYDPEYNEVTVWTQVRNWAGFFRRLWSAVKFVFKIEDLAWDCSILKPQDIARLKKLLEEVK